MDAKELQEAIKELPPVRGNGLWSRNRKAMREHILAGSMEDMFNWSTIRAAMYVGSAGFVEEEADYIFFENEDSMRWEKAVVDPGYGNESVFEYARKYVFGRPSPSLIHQAYYIKRWEDHTGKRVDDLEYIFEFGGGYGAMTYVCRKLGFEGIYVIYDFPELSLLQEHYLSVLGIKDVVYSKEPMTISVDLLISLWAITETKRFDRIWVEERVSSEHVLMAYANEWGGVDNSKWANAHFDGKEYGLPHISRNLGLLLS